MDNKNFPEQEDEVFPAEPMEEPEISQEDDAITEEIAQSVMEIFQEEDNTPPSEEDEVFHEDMVHPGHEDEELETEDHAMALHGMEHPGEIQQPFDLDVLNDPELDEPEEEEEDLSPTPVQQEIFRDEEFHEAFGDGEEFDEIFNAPVEEKPIPTHDRPARKGRPRRRHSEFLFGIPQLAVTGVWIALILVIGVTLGRMAWACAADVLAFGKDPKAVTITVYESDTVDDIIDKLHQGGLIRYPGLFRVYASLAVDEGEIKPGIWDLNTIYDYHALVSMMSPSSNMEEVEVLIPEGYTCRQIFALLEENRVCTAVDLAAYAANGELDEYWFLEGVNRGQENCLEGYLFPDTYKFYRNDSPRSVLQKMLNNFDNRITEELRSQLDSLNANVTGGTFSMHDVIIVASLIEKETSSNDESPKIASVIYNRLFNWGGTPAYLNIDAALVYALDGKTDLTAADTKIDSPYNTYTNTGLTPGPIANPGLASVKAALNPADTNYYFYVLDPAAGSHKFSTTLDEHNAFIASLE